MQAAGRAGYPKLAKKGNAVRESASEQSECGDLEAEDRAKWMFYLASRTGG